MVVVSVLRSCVSHEHLLALRGKVQCSIVCLRMYDHHGHAYQYVVATRLSPIGTTCAACLERADRLRCVQGQRAEKLLSFGEKQKRAMRERSVE